MCGIVALYLKNDSMESQLGALFEPMLISMTDRGPDSAGFAIYGDEVADDWIKITLRHENLDFPWAKLADYLITQLSTEVIWFQNYCVAVFKIKSNELAALNEINAFDTDILILSSGKSIEILKEVGLPQTIADNFNLKGMKGSHIIGHTRMATESAVTMAGSHPFSTGWDLCLVHNGSLSNHNQLRQILMQQSIDFQTDNDSEVAAGFLMHHLRTGKSLAEALDYALDKLDGFYTFAIGTRDGFAVLRDPIACKPAVLAETDDYVAMASEYRAFATLPGIKNAKVWEPAPATLYVWERGMISAPAV